MRENRTYGLTRGSGETRDRGKPDSTLPDTTSEKRRLMSHRDSGGGPIVWNSHTIFLFYTFILFQSLSLITKFQTREKIDMLNSSFIIGSGGIYTSFFLK